MAARYVFELADSQDDAQLRACMANNTMGEGISISFRREPCYFDACKIQGDNYQIIKCTDTKDGHIVGLGSRFVLSAYINGRPGKVGYLADLRGEPKVRNGTLLARGYRFLRELQQRDPLDYYYTLVLSNNATALAQLTSQRAGLPSYKHRGKILSPAIHLDLPKAAIQLNGVHFTTATPANLAEVFAFIQTQYARKQFAPVYALSHFNTERLRGLAAEDIYIAHRHNRIVATLAAWDQSAFRQTHIERYSTGLRWLLPFYNGLARWTPLKPLPMPGSPISHLYFTLLAVEHDDVDIFRALLRYVYRERRLGRWHYAIAGIHEQDPLANCLMEYRHIAASGELFSVHYPDKQREIEPLDQRIPYIEIACA